MSTPCQPYVMISYSDDGGMTFSHEIKKPLLNCHKNYHYRVVLQRQGSAYKRIYKIKDSNNHSFTLVAAYAHVSVGI